MFKFYKFVKFVKIISKVVNERFNDFKFYNVLLTKSEIQQNFRALAPRFKKTGKQKINSWHKLKVEQL